MKNDETMKMYEIEVSILVLTYNQEKFVEKALTSILSQATNFTYEIIVGDDFSTDKTGSILQSKFGDKVQLILRKENMGGVNNFCDLAEKARGKYITCLEGDDYWTSKNRLQILYDYMENHKTHIGVGHYRIIVDENNTIIGKDETNKNTNCEFALCDFRNAKKKISMQTILFKNIFYDKKKDYLKHIKCANKHQGDASSAIILLSKGKIFIMNKYLSAYRIVQKGIAYNYNSLFSRYEKAFNEISIYIYWEKYYNRPYLFSQKVTIAVFNYLYGSIKSREKINFIGLKNLLDFNYRVRIGLKLIPMIFVKIIKKIVFWM